MAPIILSIRDVAKSFGNLRALDGVSLDVEERKVVILIGPNGSGKTTLINVISGLYKPDNGKILFRKRDATGLAPFKLYDMGLARTFQIPALFWKLTVLENLLVAEKRNPGESFFKSLNIVGLRSWSSFFRPWRDTLSNWRMTRGQARIRGPVQGSPARKTVLRAKNSIRFVGSFVIATLKPWKDFFTPAWQENEIQTAAKAARILSLLGLSRVWNQPSYLLSGGQMKLVEIGRALMSDAKLLLLDEPVSGVNPTLAHEIFSRLLTLRDELGLTFFIVEHRLDVALQYVDQMFVMALGKVIASGLPKEVVKDKRVIEAYLGG